MISTRGSYLFFPGIEGPSVKLIIQIPCFNEETTLPAVIHDLPRELPGVDCIEYLVIDDGSTDRTVEVARELGVHHILRQRGNGGLARAFSAGIQACLEHGADIIVNTDGDNQYKASCIGELIRPILENSLDIVVGARPIETIEHFSWHKKLLQRWGSQVVRSLSGTDVPDTTSGFRAYSADAAMQIQVFNPYTYTLETIIQAGHMRMRIGSVPIEVNDKTRESRLISSIPQYILRSTAIMLRTYVMYKPLKTFLYLSIWPLLVGLILCLRFLYYYFFTDHSSGKVQSLILATTLLIVGFILITLGLVADLISANRRLLQELRYRISAERYRRHKEGQE